MQIMHDEQVKNEFDNHSLELWWKWKFVRHWVCLRNKDFSTHTSPDMAIPG